MTPAQPVGDAIIDREQPETMFRHVADVFRSADIAYVTLNRFYPIREPLIQDKLFIPVQRSLMHISMPISMWFL